MLLKSPYFSYNLLTIFTKGIILKRYFFVIFTIFLFVIMLLFPGDVFQGARNGLLLWFETVLPTLLPFLIIVNIMLRTSLIRHISRLVYPVLGPLFSVSPGGCFAVLTGFLCGYPMGAKVTADLVRDRRISSREGAYLLSFCNNTSPGFMAGFVVCQTIGDPSLVFGSMIIFLLVPVVLSFAFCRIYLKKETHPAPTVFHGDNGRFSMDVLDLSIMDSFETITKIGGYIIVFSVFLELACKLPFAGTLPGRLLLSFLEITNGVVMLETLPLPFSLRYACIMGLCAFGGFCAGAQTNGMLNGSGLKITPYIAEKLAAGAAASLMAYLYIQIL